MAVVNGGGGGGTYLQVPSFEVKVGSLADFLGFIERELDLGLDPGVRQISTDAEQGLDWCTGVTGPKIAYSWQNYAFSQRYPVENLARYLLTGLAMLEVIEALIPHYRNAEDLAALTTEEVQARLSDAYLAKYEAMQEATPPT